ncbi:hypothetical protein MG293_000283 [Ovis ammon polii]|uniref:Uncharacterized protein n=1 Tax=Ovis ammon polii TaxID=230172 RepID=A0AAD4UIQ3_OVIAM|nr:hypothetical protein MG293_000283 [Ovis ammon polii]
MTIYRDLISHDEMFFRHLQDLESRRQVMSGGVGKMVSRTEGNIDDRLIGRNASAEGPEGKGTKSTAAGTMVPLAFVVYPLWPRPDLFLAGESRAYTVQIGLFASYLDSTSGSGIQLPGINSVSPQLLLNITKCLVTGIKYSYDSLVVLVVKNLANAGDVGLIPGLGRYPGEGNGNSLQYSCLENSMDRGAWWATVHGATVGHD